MHCVWAAAHMPPNAVRESAKMYFTGKETADIPINLNPVCDFQNRQKNLNRRKAGCQVF